MKKFLIIFSCVIIFSIIYVVENFEKNKNNYEIKIIAKIGNLKAKEIDAQVAEEIKDKISNLEMVKDVYIFSYDGYCNIYCKLNPTIIFKQTAIDMVKTRLTQALYNVDKRISVFFDDNNSIKYDTFITISTNNDYKNLKALTDSAHDKLLDYKIASKIIKMGEQKTTIFVNYKTDNLRKYNLSISDLSDLINNNNIYQNSSTETTKDSSFPIYSNASIKNIKDIEKIRVYYKNSQFSNNLGDIFEVKETTTTPPESLIFYDDKKTQILALRKKEGLLRIIYDIKLAFYLKELKKQNEDIKVIKTNTLDTIDVYTQKTNSIYKTEQLYEKISSYHNIRNIIYLIGINSPKINNDTDFFEQEFNKITILCPKYETRRIKAILNKLNIDYATKEKKEYCDKNLENLYLKISEYKKEKNIINSTTDKKLSINYNINDKALNAYKMDKKEIVNSLQGYYKGLECSNFWQGSSNTKIILKNDDDTDTIYVYSKNYKTLFDIANFTQKEIEENFYKISRKNAQYCSIVKFKNPS